MIITHANEIIKMLTGSYRKLDLNGKELKRFKRVVKSLNEFRNQICHSHKLNVVTDLIIDSAYKGFQDILIMLKINS